MLRRINHAERPHVVDAPLLPYSQERGAAGFVTSASSPGTSTSACGSSRSKDGLASDLPLHSGSEGIEPSTEGL